MIDRVRVRLSPSLRVCRAGLRLSAPFLDFWVRLCLAKAFFVSGMLKVGNWPLALVLARHEYPVSWLDSESAAVLGAAIEIVGPVLLVTGFLVRPAAFVMLVLSLVIQFAYQQLDVNLFWAAFFGWYVVYGAGALSLDHLIAKGVSSSALPLAPRAIAAAAWVERAVGPWYRLLLRIWLAAALVRLPVSPALFPIATMATLPQLFAWPAAILLVAGLGTSAVAGVILVVLSGMWMMAPLEGVSLYAPLFLAMQAVFGAGALSLDQALFNIVERRPVAGGEKDPHIVIVGAGFGGMACAAGLRHERVRITLIDRRNYHLFQPLLYQVATASLSPADIATPIRAVFRDDPAITVLCGTVTGVDPAQQKVIVDGRELDFDYLVLATGASHGYFGNDRWAIHAPGLKFVEDAVAVRGRILSAFEEAEATDDPAERARLLTFLICGGGPTGVELAGAIADLAHHGLTGEFRRFDPATAHIILVQSGPRILPSFPERLSAAARLSLQAPRRRCQNRQSRRGDRSAGRRGQRDAHPGGDRLMGGRCRGVAGRNVAWPDVRRSWAPQSIGRSVRAKLADHFWDRRHRGVSGLEREPGPRACAGRQTGRKLCRDPNPRQAPEKRATTAVSLPA